MPFEKLFFSGKESPMSLFSLTCWTIAKCQKKGVKRAEEKLRNHLPAPLIEPVVNLVEFSLSEQYNDQFVKNPSIMFKREQTFWSHVFTNKMSPRTSTKLISRYYNHYALL
jgi:hypothetical protein